MTAADFARALLALWPYLAAIAVVLLFVALPVTCWGMTRVEGE